MPTLERDYQKLNELATKQAAKIGRLQRELKRLKAARGLPDGTSYTLEAYNNGRAWLIRRHVNGDASDVIAYPANLDAAVTRWLFLQLGAGVEVATLADFQQVVAAAKDEILEQLGVTAVA